MLFCWVDKILFLSLDVDVVNRMKLLFIFILFVCFLLLGSSISQEKKGNIVIAGISSEQSEMLFPDMVRSELRSSSQPAVLFRNLFLPGKQLDTPEDHDHGFQVIGKTLPGHRRQVLTAQVRTLFAQKFMRLLSARYMNGFYIYSLEKLII